MGSGFAMDQGAILQQQLPIHDYPPLSSEHDYNDQFSGHTHHTSYTTGGIVDHPLRRDGPGSLQAPVPFAFTATNGAHSARFVPDRGVAPDSSSYHASNNFTDSSSGSISTSPSSAGSSLAYTNYQHNHCTNIPSFAGAVSLPQAFVHATYTTSRAPPIPGSGMLPPPNPIRSPISSPSNATDREVYPNSTSFLARMQLSPGNQIAYGSYPGTPRSQHPVTGLTASDPPYATNHMASPGYQQTECGNFPWPNLEVHAEMTCEGQAVTPEVCAKVEKGFFRSTVDQKWTCYRRNYFSVQCHFELHPHISNGRLYLKRTNSTTSEMIQALGMRLSAAVDGSAGKSIELIQHTPKRDAGPKNKIDVVKVSPTASAGRGEHTISPHGIYQVPISPFHSTGQQPGPLLPLQTQSDPASPSSTSAQPAHLGSTYYSAAAASHLPVPGQHTAHTFERVQFKQATANNGKRRASQQYFHLIVELFADVRKETSETPVWVKVAHRVSDKIVVRGRSPSHYQNEGQPSQGGRTGSTGGGSGYSSALGSSYGSVGASTFRGASNGYGGGLTNGSYRTSTYGMHASPEHSGSSASSVDGGVTDADYPSDSVMSEAERNDIQSQEGYRYYPSALYEGVTHVGLPLPKIESSTRYKTDPLSWAMKHEHGNAVSGAQWPLSGLGRFQGVESSRGYFPGLQTDYS